MNSIIWKGVSSTSIQGLLICELPPITKPEMRIAETVIDGRDGSIIEELGYSSYVKTVTIGLHGNFDINKVIKYFTGEGDIVFSNEPDKVYKAKICGKIDYTRLLRYRQASIPFMVQPFKYKLNEYLRETQKADLEVAYMEVFNEGFEDSKPLIVLKGSGTVEISVNGVGVFSYTFPEGENEVYIDSEKEDAYLGNVLKNRNMNGEFPILTPKTNKIEWSGDIESISILPRSRWL